MCGGMKRRAPVGIGLVEPGLPEDAPEDTRRLKSSRVTRKHGR